MSGNLNIIPHITKYLLEYSIIKPEELTNSLSRD